MKLLIDEVESQIGKIHIVVEGNGVCALDFEDYEDRMRTHLTRRFGAHTLSRAGDPCGFSGCLRSYFRGDLSALDGIPVNSGGTDFQRRVWCALRAIPPGHTIAYSELAKMIDRPNAIRAAGLANARNPIAIVVPCHRVIGMNGSLTGYGGGLERKRWLLEHEGVKFAETRAGAPNGHTGPFADR